MFSKLPALQTAVYLLLVQAVEASAPAGSTTTALDQLIEADCTANGVALPPDAGDATFLRRVYLDCVGRIPTPAESRAYLQSTAPDRRAQLIESLLQSDGYARHWFHFWADLLRVKTDVKTTRSGIVGSAYVEWLQSALHENRPYDQMVRDLVGRQGNVWEPENAGAVGFYQRDFGMPLDHFGALMQVFAGTRMECAQCHDHPFDRWTQMDFHHMAAFTYGVRASKYPAIYEQVKGTDRTAVNKITIPMRFASVHQRTWPLKLPHDYAYDDAQPNAPVEPEFVFGPEAHPASGAESSAAVFARWLTDAKHPRFTRVIVNRLWNELFGAPLVPPPLDDLRDNTAAWNPALENLLLTAMIAGEYDLRAFLAVALKSQAYQRQAASDEYQPGARQHFAAPYMHRMSAEQVWDSYVTLITDDPERRNFRREAYRVRYLNDLRKRAEKVCMPNLDSVLAWLRTSAGKKFVAGPRAASCPPADALAMQEKSYMKALDDLKDPAVGSPAQFYQWKPLHHQLFRASELETPMSPGHFLRTFGQSDRLQIDHASNANSVPQSLAVFNGELTAAVQNPFSATLRRARKSADPVATLFLAILTRPPSQAERDIAVGEPLQDIAAALLTTAEFLFVH